MEIHHIPVFLDKIHHEIWKNTDKFIIDATLGEGGHSEFFLQMGCRVVGIDRDPRIIAKARKRLMSFGNRFETLNVNFADSRQIFEKYSGEIDLVLFDLGISQFHYRESGGGFSFLNEEELDMTLDPSREITAGRIVNTFPEEEIADILYTYGEERRSRQIARAIVKARENGELKSARELAELIRPYYPRDSHIHPATRSFQALRIYVNDELSAIAPGIEAAVENLAPGGRAAVISYHSLEDRIVKETFRKYLTPRRNINRYREDQGSSGYSLLNKKPWVPDTDEIQANPSSRSAKLRAIFKEEDQAINKDVKHDPI